MYIYLLTILSLCSVIFYGHNLQTRCYRLTVYRLTIYRLTVYRLTIYRLTVYRLTIYRLTVYRLTIYRLTVLICSQREDCMVTLGAPGCDSRSGSTQWCHQKKVLCVKTYSWNFSLFFKDRSYILSFH